MIGIRLSLTFCVISFLLSSCSSFSNRDQYAMSSPPDTAPLKPIEKVTPNYASRMPQQIAARGEKVIIVDPRVHAWGAYDAEGNLVRGGLATAGGSWCPDIKRSCRTKVGSFRIQSLGSFSCKSSIYPLPKGGAPMPYCMFFNGKMGLHGSYNVVDGNASHGCVRLTVSDAEWVRFNFARIGTPVIVKPY